MVLFGAVASFDLVWNLVDFFMGYFVTFSILFQMIFLFFCKHEKWTFGRGRLDVKQKFFLRREIG